MPYLGAGLPRLLDAFGGILTFAGRRRFRRAGEQRERGVLDGEAGREPSTQYRAQSGRVTLHAICGSEAIRGNQRQSEAIRGAPQQAAPSCSPEVSLWSLTLPLSTASASL